MADDGCDRRTRGEIARTLQQIRKREFPRINFLLRPIVIRMAFEAASRGGGSTCSVALLADADAGKIYIGSELAGRNARVTTDADDHAMCVVTEVSVREPARRDARRRDRRQRVPA